jgi:hypothetical protein
VTADNCPKQETVVLSHTWLDFSNANVPEKNRNHDMRLESPVGKSEICHICNKVESITESGAEWERSKPSWCFTMQDQIENRMRGGTEKQTGRLITRGSCLIQERNYEMNAPFLEATIAIKEYHYTNTYSRQMLDTGRLNGIRGAWSGSPFVRDVSLRIMSRVSCRWFIMP